MPPARDPSGIAKRCSRCRTTIPKELRDALGIGAGTEVEFERDRDTIVVRKTSSATGGRRIVEHLRGRGDVAMTTDEIMALTRES